MNNISAFIGASRIVIENRHKKSRLVRYIKMVLQEYPVQAANEFLIAASHFNNAAHILWSVERVGPDISLVEEVRPGSADDEIRGSPCSIRVTRSQKTLEAFYGHILIP